MTGAAWRLVSFGNAFLLGRYDEDGFANAALSRGVARWRFDTLLARPHGIAPLRTVARDPYGWFRWLRKKGYRRPVLRVTQRRLDLPRTHNRSPSRAQGPFGAVEKLDAHACRGSRGQGASPVHNPNRALSHGSRGVRRFSPLFTALLLVRRSFSLLKTRPRTVLKRWISEVHV